MGRRESWRRRGALGCWLAVVLCAGSFVACGAAGPAKSPEVAEPVEEAPAPAAPEASLGPAASDPGGERSAESAVPDRCAEGQSEKECTPPAAWVEKLCKGVYAEVALVMFRGGSPWQRRYVRGKTRAVNASGGATVDGFLSFDEEVLVLRQRKGDASGMEIGDGSGQYDVLRWNGSCVSLEAGEVTTRRPSSPGHARIEWSWLNDGMRSALRQDEDVSQAFLARKKECRGATTGSVSKACERLDGKLIQRIADYVRSGPELPAPEEHP